MKTRSFVSYEFILIVKLTDRVTACSHTARWPREIGKWAQSSIKSFPGCNMFYFSSKTIILDVHFQRREH